MLPRDLCQIGSETCSLFVLVNNAERLRTNTQGGFTFPPFLGSVAGAAGAGVRRFPSHVRLQVLYVSLGLAATLQSQG